MKRVVHGRHERQAKQSSGERGTEEMRKWRGYNQDEMDQCWKKLAEKEWKRRFCTSTRSKNSKREAYRARGLPAEMEARANSKEYRIRKW